MLTISRTFFISQQKKNDLKVFPQVDNSICRFLPEAVNFSGIYLGSKFRLRLLRQIPGAISVTIVRNRNL